MGKLGSKVMEKGLFYSLQEDKTDKMKIITFQFHEKEKSNYGPLVSKFVTELKPIGV